MDRERERERERRGKRAGEIVGGERDREGIETGSNKIREIQRRDNARGEGREEGGSGGEREREKVR